MYRYDYIKSTTKIENAYEDWKEFRAGLTEFIMNRVSEGDSVAILGAGRCSDIEINDLLEAGAMLDLYDMDETAMYEALERENVELINMAVKNQHENVTVNKLNLWPVTDDDYYRFEEMLHCHSSMDEIIEFLDELTEKLKKQKISLNKHYDLIIMNGLHSQLNAVFPAIFMDFQVNNISAYEDEELIRFLMKLRQMNEEAVEFLDELVSRHTDRVIVGYEYSRHDEGDESIDEIIRLYESGKGGEAKKIKADRVEGALSLEQDIGARYYDDLLEIKAWRYLKWNYLKEKTYLMVVYDLLLKK